LHLQAARLRCIARERYIDQAAKVLRSAAEAEPQLSRASLLEDAQARMTEAVAALRREPLRGWRHDMRDRGGIGGSQFRALPLQGRAVSAYQEMPGRMAT
jgi:hypothetical protein